jgi:ABC-2 type transport system ATP-binding protein
MNKHLAIKAEKLTKIYSPGTSQEKLALDAIDFEIPRGSFFGLLGPNGAGKSTFINILSGVTTKTSGSVKICGYDLIKQEREAKSSIGVVPQELVLDPFFSVREALEFHAGYYGIPKNERKTQEIIEALGLADKADSTPRSLSGGMRRRLLIGKALVHSPQVLILDEPTAGVDIDLRLQLWAYIKKLNKEGVTIVLTTHYLEEAEQLCDYIAIIDEGKIMASEKKDILMKNLDYKQLIIDFDKPLTSIPKGFRKNLFSNVEILKTGSLKLQYRTSQISFDKILEELVSLQNKITNITTEEANLEDVFRNFTK